MFAPNADQMHVVNHCEGKPTEEKRNILHESARIARGDVADLAKLNVSAFDAVIIPGKPESHPQSCSNSYSYSSCFRGLRRGKKPL